MAKIIEEIKDIYNKIKDYNLIDRMMTPPLEEPTACEKKHATIAIIVLMIIIVLTLTVSVFKIRQIIL